MADSAHETLGRHFRTPSHPDVITALGRALYNFLSLEETVAAVLFEAGFVDLGTSRALMAGPKEARLRDLAALYGTSTNGTHVEPVLDTAADAFGAARAAIRNQVAHSHPFTAGSDSSGNYVPGLAYTSAKGVQKIVATSPSELLDAAAAVEDAINPLSAARDEVRALPVAQLV